jgi:hypothetical protein
VGNFLPDLGEPPVQRTEINWLREMIIEARCFAAGDVFLGAKPA